MATKHVLWDPIWIYAQSGRDPIACIAGGLHHLVAGELGLFGIHLVLLVGWVVNFSVFSALRGEFLDVCCYGQPTPTAATYHIGGSCQNPQSLMGRYDPNGGDCKTMPTGQIVTLALGVAFVVAQLFFYLAYYKKYEVHVQGKLRTLHDRLHDMQVRALICKSVQCLQIFPITGIIMGLPERRFFVLRLMVFVICVVTLPPTIAKIIENRCWGSYTNYDDQHKADVGVLEYGLSYDVNSVIFSMQHGSYTIWDVTWYWVAVSFPSCALWLYLVIGRLVGVQIGPYVFMNALHEDYVRDVGAYRVHKLHGDEDANEPTVVSRVLTYFKSK